MGDERLRPERDDVAASVEKVDGAEAKGQRLAEPQTHQARSFAQLRAVGWIGPDEKRVPEPGRGREHQAQDHEERRQRGPAASREFEGPCHRAMTCSILRSPNRIVTAVPGRIAPPMLR